MRIYPQPEPVTPAKQSQPTITTSSDEGHTPDRDQLPRIYGTAHTGPITKCQETNLRTMATELTEAEFITCLSELHNDITCQIDLNPPENVVSPYQLKLHMQQLEDTLSSYISFILNWNTLIKKHSDNIGADGVQGWQQWNSHTDKSQMTLKAWKKLFQYITLGSYIR